jgi:bifunctional non-homologous end joining protein LigD
VTRLAVQVEDHPYDYRTFEGVIPEGNYGAGTVEIWDEGTYQPAEVSALTKKEMETEIRGQLSAGKIKFILHGKKLNGTFALVKASYRGNRSWLLMKLRDELKSRNPGTSYQWKGKKKPVAKTK